MQQMQDPPEGVGPLRSRRRPPRRRAPVTLPEAWSAQDIEAILASYQDAVAAQIEQGVRALHHTAVRLMGQIAEGVDRVSPEDSERALLAHVDERYTALNLRMERLEGALRQLVQTFKHEIRGSDGGSGGELATRLEGVAHAVKQSAAQQRSDIHALATEQRDRLEEFTRRTSEGLAQVAARAGEGMARMAQRQEEALDRRLEEMRQAIEGLDRPVDAPEEDGGPSPAAERAVSIFAERLRAAEGRLASATDEIRSWDPFEQTPERGPDPA
jgi:hypothetical protein